MTGVLNELRARVAEELSRNGVQAVPGMEPQRRRAWTEPVAAVSLAGVNCAPGGFGEYLGLQAGRELYGRSVELTLSLDLYAPADGGESACQQAACAMTETLICHGAGGLPVESLDTGAVEFLERAGLYRLPVRCRCRGWLVAAADDSGAFIDFEVKGSKR